MERKLRAVQAYGNLEVYRHTGALLSVQVYRDPDKSPAQKKVFSMDDVDKEGFLIFENSMRCRQSSTQYFPPFHPREHD